MSTETNKNEQKQFSQANPSEVRSVDLGQQYKSIGISAVSAAAAATKRKPSGSGEQMS